MFGTAKFRTNYFVDEDTASDEMGIVAAHLHNGCARKTNTMGETLYSQFCDMLGRGILEYRSHVLCMDADTALWTVVPELRARGFMVSMSGFSLLSRHARTG